MSARQLQPERKLLYTYDGLNIEQLAALRDSPPKDALAVEDDVEFDRHLRANAGLDRD